MKKWFCAVITLLFVSGVIGYTSTFRISQNLYEVDPGKFFRSAQLARSELEETVRLYGIKTVISVRGYPQPILSEEPEAATLERENVTLYKFDLTTDYFPSKENLVGIIELLKTAPRPILVHCRTGADRTGMISAIYQIEEMHKTKEEALKQLSFKYWHVRSFHPAMAGFVRTYQGESWAKNAYDPCDFPKFVEHSDECNPKTSRAK